MTYGLQKDSLLTEAFIKTVDENVVDRWRAYWDEIYLDKLQQQIDYLQQQIDAAKTEVSYPPGVSDKVKEVIDWWNAHVMSPEELENLENQKAKLESLQAKALLAEPTQIGP